MPDTETTLREWTYVVPNVTRPLSANQLSGGHWATGAKLRRAWRAIGVAAWYSIGRPRCDRFTVELHYRPANRRTRDPENLYPSVKAAVDGLVSNGRGIAVDDSPDYYDSTLPTIHDPVRGEPGRVWLIIRELA